MGGTVYCLLLPAIYYSRFTIYYLASSPTGSIPSRLTNLNASSESALLIAWRLRAVSRCYLVSH